jgi:hypothetical protein
MNYMELAKTHKRVAHKEKLDEYCSLEALKEAIGRVESAIPPEAIEVNKSFDLERSYGYYDSTNIEIHISAYYWIALTKEELEQRVETAKKAAATKRANAKQKKLEREQHEREQYEKLKAKFEKAP